MFHAIKVVDVVDYIENIGVQLAIKFLRTLYYEILELFFNPERFFKQILLLFFILNNEFAGPLLEILALTPLVSSLLSEYFFKISLGISFVEKVIDLLSIVFSIVLVLVVVRACVFKSGAFLLLSGGSPDHPLLFVTSFKQLHFVNSDLAEHIIIGNILVSKHTRIILHHAHIFSLACGVHFNLRAFKIKS